MTILFYSPIADETEQRLQRALEAASLNESLEIHRDIESLNRRLRKPRYNLDIAVINVDSKESLGAVLSIREMFDGIRIILILPDNQEETVREGHALAPRFLTYSDGNMIDVAAVLNKMLERVNSFKRLINMEGKRKCQN